MTRPRAAALAAADDPAWARGVVIGTAIAFVGLFVLVPLAAVFREALRAGLAAYGRAISDPVALAAAKLTSRPQRSAPLNVVFGIAAAWGDRAVSLPRPRDQHHRRTRSSLSGSRR